MQECTEEPCAGNPKVWTVGEAPGNLCFYPAAHYYSLKTGKRTGIVLILESEKDLEFWIKLNTTIEYFKLPIETWMVRGQG